MPARSRKHLLLRKSLLRRSPGRERFTCRVLMLERIAEHTNWQRVFRTRGMAMHQHPGNEERFAVVKSSDGDGRASVERALAGGDPQRVGWFRFYFDDDRWEWSPQVERMHGYLPGSVTPTTEVVLAHKHPDDYRQIADTLELIRQSRQAFSSRHRMIDVQGRVHHVVVVGDLLHGIDGAVIGHPRLRRSSARCLCARRRARTRRGARGWTAAP